MEIIIDTNFLLTCLKQKIDLFLELERLFGMYQIVIPSRVLIELETLKYRKELSVKDREAASLALQVIEKNRKKINIIELNGGADRSIVNYSLSNPGVIMASLDRGMKKHVKGKAKMLTIRGKNRLAVI